MCTNYLSFSVTTISHCSCIAFLILKQAVVTSISSNVRLCVIGGKIIYPKELGQVVKNIGGYQFVKQNRKWQDVRRSLGLPEISSFGHQINKAYLAYFGPQAGTKKINNIEIENVVDAVVDAAVTSSFSSSSPSFATSTLSLDKTTTNNEVTE